MSISLSSFIFQMDLKNIFFAAPPHPILWAWGCLWSEPLGELGTFFREGPRLLLGRWFDSLVGGLVLYMIYIKLMASL